MDLLVNIGCFLNNIVVIDKKTLVLSKNGNGNTAPLFDFTQVAFSQSKNFKKLHQFLKIKISNYFFNIYRKEL